MYIQICEVLKEWNFKSGILFQLEERKKYESSRRKTFHLMMENEQRNIEALRSKLVVTNDSKTLDELSKAENRLKTIQNQLLSLIGPLEVSHAYKCIGVCCLTCGNKVFVHFFLNSTLSSQWLQIMSMCVHTVRNLAVARSFCCSSCCISRFVFLALFNFPIPFLCN